MKILNSLLLVGLMTSCCMVYAMGVKDAQDKLDKANAAVRQASTQAARKTAVDALAKAKKDLAEAKAAEATATTQTAVQTAVKAASQEQAEQAQVLGLGDFAIEEKGKDAEQMLRNVNVALKAASIALAAVDDDKAAKQGYYDASGKKTQPLQLALASLPIEFLSLKVGWSVRRNAPVYEALYGTQADVCKVKYQPSWGQAKSQSTTVGAKAAIEWTAKTIAQARMKAENDEKKAEKWAEIVKALAA
jgi:hypothetical protein